MPWSSGTLCRRTPPPECHGAERNWQRTAQHHSLRRRAIGRPLLGRPLLGRPLLGRPSHTARLEDEQVIGPKAGSGRGLRPYPPLAT